MMRHRWLLAAGLAVSLLVATPESAAAAPCWRPPVVGAIIDHFREPSCPYCAGNRGIEYQTSAPVGVRSVEAGRVVFSGAVARTRYVVVELRNGWKLTYGGLGEATVRRGDEVGPGTVLGTVAGRFHFGLRVNGVYRDPAPFFGRLVGRPRLVPIDGTSRRPPPPAVWSCRP
jgi:murein DD-endopeptidase MepM/ murein hydrolase activator NlpD